MVVEKWTDGDSAMVKITQPTELQLRQLEHGVLLGDGSGKIVIKNYENQCQATGSYVKNAIYAGNHESLVAYE